MPIEDHSEELPKWVHAKGEISLFTSSSDEVHIEEVSVEHMTPTIQDATDQPVECPNAIIQPSSPIEWMNSIFGSAPPEDKSVFEVDDLPQSSSFVEKLVTSVQSNLTIVQNSVIDTMIDTVDTVQSNISSFTTELTNSMPLTLPDSDRMSLSQDIINRLASQEIDNDASESPSSTYSVPSDCDIHNSLNEFAFSPQPNIPGSNNAQKSLKHKTIGGLTRLLSLPNPFLQGEKKKTGKKKSGLSFMDKHAIRNKFPGHEPRGFSFCPGGLLLSYHLGVAKVLLDFGYISDTVPLAGSSAGCLAAVVLGLNIPLELVLRALLRVEDKCEIGGARNKLKDYLVDEIGELFDESTYQKLNNREAAVTVAYRRVWPLPFKSRFINVFEGNADLFTCMIASCNIPFYTTDSMSVNCREENCVDGYFSVPTQDFGCPSTGADRNIRVICFPLDNLQVEVKDNDCISPSMIDYDSHLDSESVARFYRYLDESGLPSRDSVDLKYHTSTATPKEADAHPLHSDPKQSRGDLSQCHSNNWGLLTYGIFHLAGLTGNISGSMMASEANSLTEHASCENWLKDAKDLGLLPSIPFSLPELLIIALDHVNDHVLRTCFESGRADAFRWIVREERRTQGSLMANIHQDLDTDQSYVGLADLTRKL
eukprot:GHVH01000219.1.p1 GENE.GHVH01000219.1~~GHVH01000219.1.p1  ORF type:complete len:652 (+),score=73.47 GHVH01000219.1:72-2027(+)